MRLRLRRARLRKARVHKARVRKARLRKARLRKARFVRLGFVEPRFERERLAELRLVNRQFVGAGAAVASATSSSQNTRASSRANSVAKRRSRISSGSETSVGAVSHIVRTRSTIRRRSRVAPPTVPTKPISSRASSAARNAGNVDSGSPARVSSAGRLAPPRSWTSAVTRLRAGPTIPPAHVRKDRDCLTTGRAGSIQR